MRTNANNKLQKHKLYEASNIRYYQELNKPQYPCKGPKRITYNNAKGEVVAKVVEKVTVEKETSSNRVGVVIEIGEEENFSSGVMEEMTMVVMVTCNSMVEREENYSRRVVKMLTMVVVENCDSRLMYIAVMVTCSIMVVGEKMMDTCSIRVVKEMNFEFE